MLAVRAHRVVQASRRLEHEVAFRTRADEPRELDIGRHLVTAAPDLRPKPVFHERVEPLLERIVDRDLDVGLAYVDGQPGEPLAVPRLDGLHARPVRQRRIENGADRALRRWQLLESRRGPHEPCQRERVRAHARPSVLGERLGRQQGGRRKRRRVVDQAPEECTAGVIALHRRGIFAEVVSSRFRGRPMRSKAACPTLLPSSRRLGHRSASSRAARPSRTGGSPRSSTTCSRSRASTPCSSGSPTRLPS